MFPFNACARRFLSFLGASHTSAGRGFFLEAHPEGCLRIRGALEEATAQHPWQNCAPTLDGFKIVDRAATSRRRGGDCVTPVAKLRADTASTLDGFKIVECAATSGRVPRAAILHWFPKQKVPQQTSHRFQRHLTSPDTDEHLAGSVRGRRVRPNTGGETLSRNWRASRHVRTLAMLRVPCVGRAHFLRAFTHPRSHLEHLTHLRTHIATSSLLFHLLSRSPHNTHHMCCALFFSALANRQLGV